MTGQFRALLNWRPVWPVMEFEIAVADLTPPDVASASIHVVRAVAAGLQPLHCGFGMEFSRKLEASTLAEEGAEPGTTPILLTEPAASSGFCDGGTLDV